MLHRERRQLPYDIERTNVFNEYCLALACQSGSMQEVALCWLLMACTAKAAEAVFVAFLAIILAF